MNTKILSFVLLFSLSSVLAQTSDTTKLHINYRRTDPNNPPPTTNYQLPKEQVFPLGWNNRTFNKITNGTGVWTELNPKVPRVDYFGIDFINPDTGWACGGSGAIIKTTNGGDDWTIAETPVTNLLLKINSYNGQVVICTGYDGLILRSSDGGEIFEQVASGVGSGTDLWGVQMLNDTLGWVCGLNQTLLKTTDAGQSWQQVFPGLNQHYWSLDFISEQFGMIACGGGIILKTTDGGNSWTQHQLEYTDDIYTLDIIDALHIAAGGQSGRNYYSSDGGVNWFTKERLTDDLNWIEFINTDTGYCVLNSLGLRKTTNRGDSWFSPVITDIGYWQLDLLSDEVGYSAGSELQISKTENGDDNWLNVFLIYNWSDVFFINESKGFFLTTAAPLYKTEDGGISYQKVDNSFGGNDMLFLDSLTGFIGSNTIYKTSDGGNNWYSVNIEDTTGIITKIFFINPTTGWAVTNWSSVSNGKILKTTDGGENWFVQAQQPSVDAFTSIFFVDSLNGWATSRYVWQTTDGGANWIQRTDIPAFFSQDVYFNDSIGFIIDFLTLYKSTDFGVSWFIQINSPYIIKNFGWMSDSHGLIMGGSVVYETTDSGGTWNLINELNNVGLQKFHSPSNYLGYSVGTTGLIYRYIDTSYVPVELISFSGMYSNDKITLHWQTATELNNKGFEIQKSTDKKNWRIIDFVNGSGTTSEIRSYSYQDNNLFAGKNYYQLKQIDFDGTFQYSDVIEVDIPIENFSLSQNFPNPFNPITTIRYAVQEKSFIKISIYDVKGEKISDLVNEEKDKGLYSIVLDSKNLSSGVYFYMMTSSSGYRSTKKLTIIK